MLSLRALYLLDAPGNRIVAFSDGYCWPRKDKNYMTTVTETLFEPLTIATAPEGSRPMLEKVQKSLRFIPNLMGIFANNPTVLEGYLALGAVFDKGSFTPRERQIILLAASVENHCNYCATTHSQIAKSLLHTPAEVIAAVHNNTPIPDAKLNALVSLVRELVRERGYAKENTIQNFLTAGYKKEQVMELLLGIALKTISNYLDHISPTPLDAALVGESK